MPHRSDHRAAQARRTRFPALALLVVCAAGTAAGPAAAQETTRGWPAAATASIRVFNLAGATRIVGWDRDSVAVTGTVAAPGRVYGGGSRTALKLGVEPAIPGGDPPSATLEIRVPRRAVVSVKSATADVDVSGFAGSLEIASVGGNVVVTGAPRELRAETMSGGVRVVGDAPIARVRTAGGEILIEGRPEDLWAESVSGTIVVRGGAPRQVRLESVTGAIRYDGALAPDGVLTVQTHEASVTLVLPAAIGASFDLTTFDGLLVNRFGSAAARPSRGGKPLRFEVNGGGARVEVRTLKGDVAVYRR